MSPPIGQTVAAPLRDVAVVVVLVERNFGLVVAIKSWSSGNVCLMEGRLGVWVRVVLDVFGNEKREAQVRDRKTERRNDGKRKNQRRSKDRFFKLQS
jgi:hypothetical protein